MSFDGMILVDKGRKRLAKYLSLENISVIGCDFIDNIIEIRFDYRLCSF